MGKFVILLVLLGLTACSFMPEKPLSDYQLSDLQYLQKQRSWRLQGRLAIVDDTESISASVNWRHEPGTDDIDLVGPLAQGRLSISVSTARVMIDDGEKRQEYLGDIDEIIREQMGVDLPVSSLKYWVLGVNDPRQNYTEQEGGFFQAGWLVRFREMQQVNADRLPKKVTVEKDKTRIKLIVDQWDLS